jgi:outer membrane lipoprotein SlyB
MSLRHRIQPFLAAALLTALAGCYQGTAGPKQTGGTLLGAGLGAFAGSQIGSGRGQLAATAIGAVAGAAIGNDFGRSLDRADKLHQRASADRPRTHHRRQRAASHCRKVRQSVRLKDGRRSYYGTACRTPRGGWTIH